HIIGIDSLTYAGSRESVGILANDPLFQLVEADIANARAMAQIFMDTAPDGIIHLAAETHVDRSIDAPADFLRTNIVGTYSLLETTRIYLASKEGAKKHDTFRFLHVSTDEVYGSLGKEGSFTEETAYAPNSPYAATKAAADHLARAWHKTHDLPVIISNASNTYGPLQFPEKLLPLAIAKALKGDPIPLYGQGENVRDWLHVEDHAKALYLIFSKGCIGEKYNVSGNNEKSNIEIIHSLCDIFDEEKPNQCSRDLITFVEDRPGHDFRYSMDSSKIRNELGWQPQIPLDEGLRETVKWYINNQNWCANIWERKYAGQKLSDTGK
ncbi:MAG TPA: dTDP-glucose 4,6-dehydratase, partial [Rhodospirillaceae bacterium]|nr:dTDP-glucose 4,6-dehydratase [Rhodospirillaceae bacterium]